jgi:cell division protein FtsB
MNKKRCFFLILLVFIFIAAFSVPVMAQEFGSVLSPAQQAEVSKKARERQEAQFKAQAERQKAEKERIEKLKNAEPTQQNNSQTT